MFSLFESMVKLYMKIMNISCFEKIQCKNQSRENWKM